MRRTPTGGRLRILALRSDGSSVNITLFRKRLEWAESREPKPYPDSVGKLTIGVGRNLDDVGLSEDEIDYLLQNDINRTLRDARSLVYWDQLSDVRRVVVADLVFNMGLSTFSRFIGFNRAVRSKNWKRAALELEWRNVETKDERTPYWKETGRRAIANAFAIERDRFPTQEELWQLMEEDK